MRLGRSVTRRTPSAIRRLPSLQPALVWKRAPGPTQTRQLLHATPPIEARRRRTTQRPCWASVGGAGSTRRGGYLQLPVACPRLRHLLLPVACPRLRRRPNGHSAAMAVHMRNHAPCAFRPLRSTPGYREGRRPSASRQRPARSRQTCARGPCVGACPTGRDPRATT